MEMPFQYWLLDFDETLVKGWDALAMKVVIPQFIRENGLNSDVEKLNQAIMNAQEQNAFNNDVQFLLKGIFEAMNWPAELTESFLQTIQSQYQPELFEDSLPFLRKLQEHKKTVYILSNNTGSIQLADYLGVSPYVKAVVTPDSLQGSPRKPDAKVWNGLVAIYLDLEKEKTAIVGDDPWSEGVFAEACNLTCWITDRYQRYNTLKNEKSYHWVTSLNDIELS